MTLDNLVRIGQLNSEPPDKREIEGLIRAAIDRLNDAENETLAFASRFESPGTKLSKVSVAGPRRSQFTR